MFKPNVDSILKGFRRTIIQLHALSKRNAEAVQQKERDMIALRNATAALQVESARALNVASKLSILIGQE